MINKVLKYCLCIFIATLLLVYSVLKLLAINDILIPFNYTTTKQIEVQKLARAFRISTTLAEYIWEVSVREGLDPFFLAALIYTESTFRLDVRSSRDYHGLTQIPWKIPYPDVNILIGAKIFKEKLRLANGDVRKALILYKGYSLESERGWKQADKVLSIMSYAKHRKDY